ncbi:MAG: 30S ribosomal protein S3, partial [Actinomycetota bacterium]|nr:30S ribosomal protein S3 [Actinomycetota bacterium]
AMAVGETSGGAERNAPVVSSGGRRTDVPVDEIEEPAPLVKEADPEFEKLLEEEEQIERATREQSQTPNFRPGDD